MEKESAANRAYQSSILLAKESLNEGLKQLSSGTGDHTNGEDVSLGYDSQQTSTKLEAHSVGSAADG